MIDPSSGYVWCYVLIFFQSYRYMNGEIWLVSISFFFLMIRRPPRSTPLYSSAASDVYKRQLPVLSAGPVALRQRQRHAGRLHRGRDLSLIHISEPTNISGSRMPSSA